MTTIKKTFHASDFYSMGAFDKAVDYLMPQIKIMNEASKGYYGGLSRPEQIKFIANNYFLIEPEELSEKQVEALGVVRSLGRILREEGRFVYGSKEFNVE